MSSRERIARRHGLPDHLAGSLHGSTPAEWEADAVARARLMGMFEPRRLGSQPSEPPASAEQGFNDSLTEALRPGAKAARDEALVRALHPSGSEER